MYCKKCGAKVEDNVNFCESCGENIATNEYNLIIARPNKIMGCAVKLHVTVNEQLYELGAGKEFKINLPNGQYTIKYKIWCRSKHEIIVNIEDNKICNVIFAYDALLGGFKISKKSVL